MNNKLYVYICLYVQGSNLYVNGIGVIHTCIYVHIYVHSIWLTTASFGSRHDLTLVVRSQTKRQQSAHSIKDQGLHSCHN